MKKSFFLAAALLSAVTAPAAVIQSGPVGGVYTIQTPYLWFTVNGKGTLGNGNGTPGLNFDPTGTATFDTSADFIKFGSPYEGFQVLANGASFENNNGGGAAISQTGVVSNTTATAVDLTWSGATADFSLSNRYYLEETGQNLKITTTITAINALTGVKFARAADPDQDGVVGSTSTTNELGYVAGGIPASDIVIARGSIRPDLVLAMYTSAALTHGAAVTGWSLNPNLYLAGGNVGNGDNTIGLGFDLGNMTAGQSISFDYYYIFAATPAALVSSLSSSGGGGPTAITTTVTEASALVQGSTATFEGGVFAPTSVFTLPDITVNSGYTGTIDSSDGNVSSSGDVTIDGTSLILRGDASISANGTLTTPTGTGVNFTGPITGAGVLRSESGNNTLSGTNTSAGTEVVGGSITLLAVDALPQNGNVINGGTVILPNSNVGTRTYAINFSLTGTGSNSVGALELGTNATADSSVLSGTVTVTGNAKLRTEGSGGTQTFAGAIVVQNAATLEFFSASGSRGVIANGSTTTPSSFTKTGLGSLTLASGSSLSAPVTVSAGTFVVNGGVTGPVTVAAGSTLGGSGTINGPVLVSGVLAPGNSPGLLVQAAGPATLAAGSSFLAELGGTVAGDGDGFHDQFFVQNGPLTISTAGAGVRLDVASWVEADGVTVFQPARTDVFTILRAANGISGTFADITNPDYSTWMIYDNSSDPAHRFGNLYGTGLTGGQSFANWGTDANRAALAGAIWNAAVTPSASSTNANPAGFIDGNTAAGRIAIALMTGASLDDTLDSWSPEVFFGASDYVLTAMRSVTDAAAGQASYVREGAWTLGAGYARAETSFVGGSSAAFNRDLQSETGFAVVSRDLGAAGRVGFFLGHNSGHTVTRSSRIDYDGALFGLNGSYRFEGSFPVTVRAAATRALLDFDSRRSVASATSGNGAAAPAQESATASDVAVRGWGGQASVEVQAFARNGVTISPLVGYVHGRSTVEAFAETGADAALGVSAFRSDLSRGLAGLSLGWQASPGLRLTLLATMEREFDRDDDVTASFAGSSFGASDTVSDRTISNVGVGAVVRLDQGATLSLGTEFRDNQETHEDIRYNASLNWRF
jgi:autotransporter-associated beta strand protein